MGSSSGYGFVRSEELAEDIFIPSDKTAGAIDGDLVEVIFHEYTAYTGQHKTEGRVTEIKEYGRKTLIGTLVIPQWRARGSYPVVYPDEPRLALYPTVVKTAGAKIGDKVLVNLIRTHGRICCEVIECYGEAGSKEANYRAILDEFGIETEFTDEELYLAEKAAQRPLCDEGRVRRDAEIILTIDGEGAKDLDDAVSLRRTRDGYLLGVHIADVSAYVTEKTALDRLAMRRGNSVYFTDKVVPMLPPSLSNGACSLNAGEDKYTLSAMISLDRSGQIKGVRLEPSIIRTAVRGVYSEVNSIFEGSATAQIKKKYARVLPTLEKMHELYLILAKKSRARGAIDMEIPEAYVLLDAEGAPCDVIKAERGDAEKMIEQFMLTANEAVASLLREKNIPCVYRIHESPSADKLEGLADYISGLGMNASGIRKENPTPKDFSQVLDAAEEKGIKPQVSSVMLRSMAKAKYSEECLGHFGLGISNYCHFTSPIRRLSDLATHRIIHRVLLEGESSLRYISYAKRAAAAATEGELRAVGAERKIEDLYKTIYISKHIGEEFEATVSSVTAFGMFCELDNTCEGLIPLSELDGDFYFDQKSVSLRSRDGRAYLLGMRIKIRVEEADTIRCKTRFSLV